MKKYLIPTMDIVNIDFYPILQPISKGDDYQPGDPVLAPQQFSDPYIWDETDSEKKAIQSGENIELID
jgi:hypothetical protein